MPANMTFFVVNETKIVKIRTQNAKRVLIKDQVLKIRTLLETVHDDRSGRYPDM